MTTKYEISESTTKSHINQGEREKKFGRATAGAGEGLRAARDGVGVVREGESGFSVAGDHRIQRRCGRGRRDAAAPVPGKKHAGADGDDGGAAREGWIRRHHGRGPPDPTLVPALGKKHAGAAGCRAAPSSA